MSRTSWVSFMTRTWARWLVDADIVASWSGGRSPDRLGPAGCGRSPKGGHNLGETPRGCGDGARTFARRGGQYGTHRRDTLEPSGMRRLTRYAVCICLDRVRSP